MNSTAHGPVRDRLAAALARPLLLGASVSADFSSFSPGKKLALRYDPHAEIRVLAQGGKPGAEVLPRLRPAMLEDRSSVLAVDLFFWDATRADPGPALAALARLVEWVKERSLPLVLGDVPELLPGMQPSRARINAEIAAAAGSYRRAAVMSFDAIYRRVVGDGFLEFQGRRWRLGELVPDGLHLAEVAGEYLAGELEKVLERVV